MTKVKFGVGQPVRRVEDDRLVRGAGRYTSDFAPGGLVHRLLCSQSLCPRSIYGWESRPGGRDAGREGRLYRFRFLCSRRSPMPANDAQFRRFADAAETVSGHGWRRGASCRRHRCNDRRRVRTSRPKTAPRRSRSTGSRFPRSPTRARRFDRAQPRSSPARRATSPSTPTSATKPGRTRFSPARHMSFEDRDRQSSGRRQFPRASRRRRDV